MNKNKMNAFLENPADTYALFQLKNTEETKDLRFKPYAYLQERGLQPNGEHYELVYHGALEKRFSAVARLENLYRKFNIDHPDDFEGHSMAFSDIIALKIDGAVSCYYVDTYGFTEIQDFLDPKDYLITQK